MSLFRELRIACSNYSILRDLSSNIIAHLRANDLMITNRFLSIEGNHFLICHTSRIFVWTTKMHNYSFCTPSFDWLTVQTVQNKNILQMSLYAEVIITF